MAANPCPCGSENEVNNCCLPFINDIQKPQSAEQLMRSRFSAYALGSYDYIIDTYHSSTRPEICASDLAQDSNSTRWLKLELDDAYDESAYSYVRFRAFSKEDGQFYCLHELSRFVKENDIWFYIDGDIQPDSGKLKPNRNSQCLCGSGKKFKRCCG